MQKMKTTCYKKILDEYEVEKEVAKADLDEFLQTLKDAEII